MRCHATARTGQQCRRTAMEGQQVCALHGGKSPQALAAAERRLTRERAMGEIARRLEGVELDGRHPVEHLLEVVHKDAVMVRAIELELGERDSLLGVNRFDEVVVHPLAGMYREWTDSLARNSKLALDAGIDDKRLQLEMAKVMPIFDAVMEGLAESGLDAETEALVRGNIAKRLRAKEDQ